LTVADDVFTRNRPLFIIAGIVLVSLVALIGYYAGRQNVTQAPVAAGRGPVRPQVTRLAPQHFDSWTLQCIQGPRGGKRCALVLMAVDKSRKHLLLRLSVVRSKKGPVLVALTPPNALLSAGFTLTPGKAQAFVAPFARCLPRACEAMTDLTEPLVKDLSGADKSQVRFVAAAGRPMEFEIPTTGFANGYAAWQKADTVPPAQAGNVPAGATPSIDATAPADPDKPNNGN
jgi:invasion protein IalB